LQQQEHAQHDSAGGAEKGEKKTIFDAHGEGGSRKGYLSFLAQTPAWKKLSGPARRISFISAHFLQIFGVS